MSRSVKKARISNREKRFADRGKPDLERDFGPVVLISSKPDWVHREELELKRFKAHQKQKLDRLAVYGQLLLGAISIIGRWVLLALVIFLIAIGVLAPDTVLKFVGL